MEHRVKTPYNAHEFPKRYEKNFEPSKTIPDQTMTIREIMDRYAKGLPISGQKVPVYSGEDDDMPDMKNLDLADQQSIIEAAREEYQDLTTRIQADRKRKQDEKIKRLVKKAQIKKEETDEKPE